jgi:hypothetical protein
MRQRFILLSLMLEAITSASEAATLPEAFSLGTQFGQSGNAAARGRIDAGTASATVPGYTTTAPAASYFGGPGLGTPAASTLANCTTSPQDPACQAVNFSQTNPAQRPTFTIAPNNPMLVRSRSITADPASIAGSLAGTYSACTTQTVTSPDIFTNRTCNEYRFLEQHTCTKTLTVSVTDNGLSCNYGDYLTPNPRIMFIRPFVFVGAICAEDIRFQWIWGYSECNGTNAAIYHHSVMSGPDYERQIVYLGCGGTYYAEGACPNGNCSYTVGMPNAIAVCTEPTDDDCNAWQYQDLPLAGFNFQRPVHTYTFTEAWDNQCATWEARLP